MSIQKKTLYWTAGGVVLTAVGVLIAVAVAMSGEGSAPASVSQSGIGNQQGETNQINPSQGDNGCVAIGGDCVVDKATDWKKARDDLKKVVGANSEPAGSGPWMFIVLGTGELKGLYVRDGYTKTDKRLPGDPLIMEGQAAYVDCRVDDGWNADPSTDGGGRWYKIRYPQVSSQGDYWAYSGFLYPVGSNGDVPICPAA